jgi:hypothetical protein
VLFPELIVHRNCTPKTWQLGEPVPDGLSIGPVAGTPRPPRFSRVSDL